MAAWTAIGLAFWTAISRATASDMADQAHALIDETPAWGLDLIPALIIVAAFILSLEIWDHTIVSRPLSAIVLIALWSSILSEHLQMASLLTAFVYHSIFEAYREYTRGFPSVFQSAMTYQKIRVWLRFWLRVFVWATTLATTRALSSSLITASSSLLVAMRMPLFIALYCECTEVLLLLYFTDEPLAIYDPRQRVLLWTASLILGVLHHSNTLAVWTIAVSQRVTPMTLAIALVAVMVVAVLVDGPCVISSMQRIKTSLLVFTRLKKKPTTNHSGKRKSFLYRTGSDVEVVGMVRHYEAYDFRHKHEDAGPSLV